MEALYSGQAGLLAILEGAEARVRRTDEIDRAFVIGREGVSYLFDGCTDVVHVKDGTEGDLVALAKSAWKLDRSLRMLLIALDSDEDDELRSEAADCLEDMLTASGTREFIENDLFARTLPTSAEARYLVDTARWPAVKAMVDGILTSQDAIEARRRAWDDLPENLFEDADKSNYEEQAIRLGAFRVFASAGAVAGDENLAILRLHELLAKLPNARAIVNAWTSNFKRPGVKYVLQPESDEQFEEEEQVSYAIFSETMRRRDAIIDTLKRGSQNLARKYAERLVRYQLDNGGASYAAKTLCYLAQEAKELHLHSLQLEWAQRAANTNPTDAWTHGQAADALIQFSRLDEALSELELSEKLGDMQFAVTGRARILRHQGRLKEALAAFRAAREQCQGYDGEPHMWSGAAETLRDMWKLRDALSEYDAALQKFPDVKFLACGRAAVLAELGRLDDALEAYNAPELRNDLIALNGKASVLKDKGRLQEALYTIEEAIQFFPADPVARCIQAEIMRLQGRYESALQLYEYVKAHHPTIPHAYAGYAEVLRDLRRWPEAVHAYEEANKRFPNDARIANGYANINKVSGNLEAALKIYEKNVQLFPYDLFAKSGRADLLRRLGQYEDAIHAYDQILRDWPDYISASNGKAAILAVKGQFDEALSLLPNQSPSTRNDWIAWHIRGMILLRSNQLKEASEFFSDALKKIPFDEERRFFQRALSATQLRQKNYHLAAQALSETGGTVSDILRFHAYAGAGRISRANVLYRNLSRNCPDQLAELRDAIAVRYGLARSGRVAAANDNWIFQRESEVLLQEAA